MTKIYLDNAATTPLDPDVMTAMNAAQRNFFANPSSVHSPGRSSRVVLEKARDCIAQSIDAQPKEIVFTSGGTESDNLAITGIAFANKDRGQHIITTAIEHSAVLNTCKFLSQLGFQISYLPVAEDGSVDLVYLDKLITPGTILVSAMMVNNETGVILPIKEIARVVHKHGVYFHCDAVQAFGKLDISVADYECDLLSLSSHKIYGPKGVGALFIKNGIHIDNLLNGGSQESGRRAGTENLIGIIGFAEAAEKIFTQKDERNRIFQLRTIFEDELKNRIEGIKINSKKGVRIFSHSNIYFPFMHSDSLLMNLDMRGVSVSTGSACSSGSITPSHVLKEFGFETDHIQKSLRFSFGRFNTESDILQTIEIISDIYQKSKRKSPSYVRR